MSLTEVAGDFMCDDLWIPTPIHRCDCRKRHASAPERGHQRPDPWQSARVDTLHMGNVIDVGDEMCRKIMGNALTNRRPHEGKRGHDAGQGMPINRNATDRGMDLLGIEQLAELSGGQAHRQRAAGSRVPLDLCDLLSHIRRLTVTDEAVDRAKGSADDGSRLNHTDSGAPVSGAAAVEKSHWCSLHH
jgi:hypothetical protein